MTTFTLIKTEAMNLAAFELNIIGYPKLKQFAFPEMLTYGKILAHKHIYKKTAIRKYN